MVIRSVATFLIKKTHLSRKVMGAKHVKSAKSHGKELTEACKLIIPPLTFDSHKGLNGRIGIIGGSKEYTGAPYFAGISALKAGADLVHIFCSKESSQVVKSYSPELIVHPLLDAENGNAEIKQWIDRLHSVVLGPGLGRDEKVLKSLEDIIQYIKERDLPLIIDADGVYLITQNLSLIKDYQKAVLTPNAVEFQRLFDACQQASLSLPQDEVTHDLLEELKNNQSVKDTAMLSLLLGNVTIVRKGKSDIITNGKQVLVCDSDGSPRRCGGQGDLLSGFMGTFAHWAHNLSYKDLTRMDPSLVSCYASCLLTRHCSLQAFKVTGRSTTCSDMVQQIHQSFVELFQEQEQKT